jgi:hypothetical protein
MPVHLETYTGLSWSHNVITVVLTLISRITVIVMVVLDVWSYYVIVTISDDLSRFLLVIVRKDALLVVAIFRVNQVYQIW